MAAKYARSKGGFLLDEPVTVVMRAIEAGSRRFDSNRRISIIVEMWQDDMVRMEKTTSHEYLFEALPIAMFEALSSGGFWKPWGADEDWKKAVLRKVQERLFRDPDAIDGEYADDYDPENKHDIDKISRSLTSAGKAAVRTLRDGRKVLFTVKAPVDPRLAPQPGRLELLADLKDAIKEFVANAEDGDLAYLVQFLREYK